MRSRNVPPNTSRVTAAGEDVFFRQEPTAADESIVRGHFYRHTSRRTVQFVHRTQVVETPTGDHIAGALFHADTHNVGRFEWDRLELVGGYRVPQEQIPVL